LGLKERGKPIVEIRGVERTDIGVPQQAARAAAVVVEGQGVGVEPQVVLVGLVLELQIDIGVVADIAFARWPGTKLVK